MKKLLLVFVCISIIFGGCSFENLKPAEIKKIENYNKKIAKEKEYEEKINEGRELLFKEKNYEKAKAVFVSASIIDFERSENDSKFYYYLGLTEYKLKKYSDAFWCFDKAIQISDRDSLIYEARGDLNFDLENWEDSIEDYSNVIKFNGGIFYIADIYKRRGVAYLNLKQYEDAIKDFEFVVKRNKYDSETYFLLGKTYLDAGNTEESLKNFEQAKKLGYFENK